MIIGVIVIVPQIVMMTIVMIVINCDTKTAVAEEESRGRTSHQYESVFYEMIEEISSLVCFAFGICDFSCICVLLAVCICCCCAPCYHQFLQLLTKYTNIYFNMFSQFEAEFKSYIVWLN